MTSRTFLVNSATSLSAAIAAIDADAPGSFVDFTISVSPGITLDRVITPITLDPTDTLVIDGQGGGSIDGGGLYRGLVIETGNVVISNVTIANATAKGGPGGNSSLGGGAGGGGLGAGGALLVDGGAITLSNVTFSNDSAVGGVGGNGSGTSSLDGFSRTNFIVGQGGTGASPSRLGGDGRAGTATTGGLGGGTAKTVDLGGGGLGGAGQSEDGTNNGAPVTFLRIGGGGGGGAGLGGAVFVAPGASLSIGPGQFTGDSAIVGAGGAGASAVDFFSITTSMSQPGSSGARAGVDLFLMTGVTTVFDPGAGRSLIFAGGIGDDSAASLPQGGGFSPGTARGAGIVVRSGTVSLGGTSTFAGGTTLTNAATLVDASANGIGPGGVVFGAGGGTLVVASIAGFTNTITGFAQGSTIDLRGLPYQQGAGVVSDGTRVTVTSGLAVATLNLAGSFAAGALVVTPETTIGRGGTVLTTTVACYAAGTRILTDHGEVAIEALRVGDRVLTVIGGGFAPIRWIGVRHVDLRLAAAGAVRPVCIVAGAFGPGLPSRDLRVSPDHALYVDGRLIPAHLLVDGAGVRIETQAASIAYYHIELDRHDVVLAEGMPAETWLDIGNRHMFENAGPLIAMHADFAPRHPAVFCALRVDGGLDLLQARARLGVRDDGAAVPKTARA